MTALPPLATVDNLADWIGEAIEADSADAKRAEGVLRMASTLVRNETGRKWLTETGTVVSDLPDDVNLVVCQSAARAYLNPEHLEQRRIDDAYGAMRVQEAGVYLTPSERSLLQQFAGDPFGGIGTISTTRGDYPKSSLEDDERILPPWY